jgi:pimeloyl-ACP methyl ester carboxylesterase
MNDSEYARFHTDQRVGVIKANPKDLEQWSNAFIFDIYTMVPELQQDDPKNLYERLTQIKAPIFLALADKEPFIPGTAFNGLKDLGRDVITPFMTRMTLAGNRPILKIYPNAGHFIHTDNPVEYAAYVTDFVTTGNVDTSSPLATDRLINGATASASAAPVPSEPRRNVADGGPEQVECTMSRVRAGEVHLGWRTWGEGDITVVFIHGNLACKEWIEFAAPLFPSGVRVIGIDWRGCGESDRPPAAPDYANYSMRQHAQDMLAVLDELNISFCHLATHSTGGIIAARMLLMQPERFGKVFALDPVTPLGMPFNEEQIGLFRAMMASREVTRAVMATAASSLFVPEGLSPNTVPLFRDGLGEMKAFFERILDNTFGVAEGIWIGTPFNLNRERESGELERRMPEIRQASPSSGARRTAGFHRSISRECPLRCRIAAW